MIFILNCEDAQGLDLNFTYLKNELGVFKEVDLIENGKNIYLNNDNRKQYIKLRAQMIMTQDIRE